MAVDDYDGQTVATGQWRYGDVPMEIEIVAFDCDYFYERMPTQDGRDVWKPYPLNEHGVLYYLKPDGDVLPLTPFRTIDGAKAWADAQPWKVQWD